MIMAKGEYPPLMVRMVLSMYYKTNNSKLKRWLEKRIANRTGGFAYSQVMRDLYKEVHGL